jgi:hypothetical protein
MQAAQASDNAFLSNTRLPHWSWGPPGRYYGRAGYRDDFGGGSSTSERALHPRRHICNTACAGWLTVHARRHQREVCPLSRWGDVATPIRPITGRHSLSPSSFTRCPIGSPCGSLSPRPPWFTGQGETTGLPRSADVPEWIGRISTPVARHLRRRSSRPADLATHLLVQAVQQLALVLCDDAYDALPGLATPLDPGSRPPCCWQSPLRLAPGRPSQRRRLRCPGAYYPGRIPLAEQRVLSAGPPTSAQLHRRLRVARE